MKLRRPWVSMPAQKKLGATRGSWPVAMIGIGVVVIAVIVVLVLVDQGRLDRTWAYACLPFAIVAAALSRVLTIFKASAEDQSPSEKI